MKILGIAIAAAGFIILIGNGSPRRWPKGAGLKRLLIDLGGFLLIGGGLALAGLAGSGS